MLTEIEPTACRAAKALLEPLFFRPDLAAAIEGTRPGVLWVDDPDAPGVALLTVSQGYALAGRPTAAAVRALHRLVTERIYSEDPLGLGRKAVRIGCHPDAWLPHLPEILGRPPIPCVKRSYRQDLADGTGEFPLPEGYEIRDLDDNLLADPSIEVDPFDLRAMEYRPCFACSAIHHGQTVATCFVNVVVGRVFEVGIGTREEHRRKGVGSAVVAATLRRGRERGLTVADWQCDVRNGPSVRMAEHLGFALHREYDIFLACEDETTHDRITARWRDGQNV